MHHLHENDIVHGDIKPQNVLYITNKSGALREIKLCDFGISRMKNSIQNTMTQSFVKGTTKYQAPETLVGRVRSNKQTDVWSLGVTLLEILTLQDGWKVEPGQDLDEFLKESMAQRKCPTAFEQLSEDDQSTLQDIFSYEAEQRPCMEVLCKRFK